MITYISKEVVSEKGYILKYHRVTSMFMNFSISGKTIYTAVIHSWGALSSMLATDAPINTISYRFEPAVGMLVDPSALDDILDVIISDTSSILYQGVLLNTDPNVADIGTLKEQKWTQVKRWRSADINTNLSTPYGVFQASPEDRSNITDAILLAQTLTSMSQPVAIPWTLADNTVITMDLTMLTNVGLLLGQKVQTSHARARTLRTAIEDPNATIESINAITWEVPA